MMQENTQHVKEKRRHDRLSLPLKVYVNTKVNGGDKLQNISEGGICFQSDNSFAENDFIFFHFYGDEESTLKSVKFSILGRIIWHDEIEENGNKYGAEFTFYNDPFSKQQRSTMISILNRYVSGN